MEDTEDKQRCPNKTLRPSGKPKRLSHLHPLPRAPAAWSRELECWKGQAWLAALSSSHHSLAKKGHRGLFTTSWRDGRQQQELGPCGRCPGRLHTALKQGQLTKPLRPMLSSLAPTVSPPSSEYAGFRFLSCTLFPFQGDLFR